MSSSRGGYVKLKVELISSVALTEFQLFPSIKSTENTAPPPTFNRPLTIEHGIDLKRKQLARDKSITLMSNNNPINGEDIENGLWQMECDLNSSFLRFSMVYQDVTKIPRNHLR